MIHNDNITPQWGQIWTYRYPKNMNSWSKTWTTKKSKCSNNLYLLIRSLALTVGNMQHLETILFNDNGWTVCQDQWKTTTLKSGSILWTSFIIIVILLKLYIVWGQSKILGKKCVQQSYKRKKSSKRLHS